MVLQPGKQRGFVLLVTGAAALCLSAIVGLSIDAGYAYYRRTLAQTAADAAAMAAAGELLDGGDLTQSGQRAAKLNGFEHGVQGMEVLIQRPPQTGAFAGDNSAVQAVVRQDVGLFFMRLLSFERMRVGAVSTARIGDGGACIYALNPTAGSALRIAGSTTVQVKCGIMVNSAAGNAIEISGSACVTAESISSVGGAAVNSGCPPDPPPVTGVDPSPDPLGHLTPPAVGPCTFTDYQVDSGSATLSPGVYCGGIHLNSSTVATMNPGTYIILGGTLEARGGAVLSGNGVTIYLTSDASHPYDGIRINGGSTVSLSAPAAGPYAGVLFFEDRNAPTGYTHYMTGSASTRFEGAVYLPRNEMKYSGGSSGVSPYTVLVADTIEFTGHSYFEDNYSDVSGGSPVKAIPVVVE